MEARGRARQHTVQAAPGGSALEGGSPSTRSTHPWTAPALGCTQLFGPLVPSRGTRDCSIV